MMTIVGYIGEFILAMLFNTDGIDQGGGRTNNGWIIWQLRYKLSHSYLKILPKTYK